MVYHPTILVQIEIHHQRKQAKINDFIIRFNSVLLTLQQVLKNTPYKLIPKDPISHKDLLSLPLLINTRSYCCPILTQQQIVIAAVVLLPQDSPVVNVRMLTEYYFLWNKHQ